MSPTHCDLVITNAVIIDHWGIVKGDIGIRDGRIVAVGKSGNPLTQSGVDPRLVIGPGTEIIAGEGKIVTAGGIDTHIHFICPQQIEVAIASRHHHADRRRHRLGHGHLGDDLHARPVEHHADAPGVRGAADQRRASSARATAACRSRSRSRSRPAPAA